MGDISVHNLSPAQLNRLRDAKDRSRDQLRNYLRQRIELFRQFQGHGCPEGGSSVPVPVNLIATATTIYMMLLAGNRPQYSISERTSRLKGTAVLSELAVNHLVEEIRLDNAIYNCVFDALYFMGVGKIGLERHATIEAYGFLHDLCQPFVDHILPEDWVHDMGAREWEQVDYCGNRYQIPYEEAMANPLFDGAAKDEFAKFERPNTEDSEYRSEQLTAGDGDNPGFRDYIEAWDLWLPKEGLLVTMQDRAGNVPMRVVEWEGPEEGPYPLLWFDKLPGNIIPTAPAQHWREIHNLANALYAKLGNQAVEEKSVLGVASSANEDGRRIENAHDGQMIRLDNPSLAQTYHYGGINQSTFAMAVHLIDEFSTRNGNINLLGGLGPQAATASQEQMLQGNASRRVDSMQSRVLKFDQQIGKQLFWYLHNDPYIQIPLIRRVPGTNISVPVTYSADAREGDYLDYNFEVVPYSIRYVTPEMEAQVMQLTMSEIMPLMGTGVLEQSGITIDWQGYLSTIAKLRGCRKFADFVKLSAPNPNAVPPIGQPPQKGHPPAKPAVTKRTYERVNRPGNTTAGAHEALIQQMMGGRQQPSQEARVLRPVS